MFVALSSLARRAAWRAIGSPGLGARSAMSVQVRAWHRGKIHEYVEYPGACMKVAVGSAFGLLPAVGEKENAGLCTGRRFPMARPDRAGAAYCLMIHTLISGCTSA